MFSKRDRCELKMESSIQEAKQKANIYAFQNISNNHKERRKIAQNLEYCGRSNQWP